MGRGSGQQPTDHGRTACRGAGAKAKPGGALAPAAGHGYVDFDGRELALTAIQVRKLNGYTRSNPNRTIRLLRRDDDGAVVVSVLADIDKRGRMVAAETFLLRADGGRARLA